MEVRPGLKLEIKRRPWCGVHFLTRNRTVSLAFLEKLVDIPNFFNAKCEVSLWLVTMTVGILKKKGETS